MEDRSYFDFQLMLERIKAKNIFVTRIKDNTVYTNVKELDLADDKEHNILRDELIILTGNNPVPLYVVSEKSHKSKLIAGMG